MNISIVGTGKIAHKMAETVLLTEGAELYAVASRSIESAKAFADEFNIKTTYGSYEELSHDENIGLVYIATPHTSHYELSKMFLNAGHNVLCEKPITINSKQAGELFEISEKKGLFITEALWTRFFPSVKTIRDILNSGEIGAPVLLDSKFGFNNQHLPRMVEPELGGGAMLDLGIYPLTIASIFFGDDFKEIETEAVLSDKGIDKRNYTTLKYSDGRRANLTSTIDTRLNTKTNIFCTKGYIEIEGVSDWRRITVFDTGNKIIKDITPEKKTGYEFELLASIEAIVNGKIECEEISHRETLFIMQTMDNLREVWGVKYPCEHA